MVPLGTRSLVDFGRVVLLGWFEPLLLPVSALGDLCGVAAVEAESHAAPVYVTQSSFTVSVSGGVKRVPVMTQLMAQNKIKIT